MYIKKVPFDLFCKQILKNHISFIENKKFCCAKRNES